MRSHHMEGRPLGGVPGRMLARGGLGLLIVGAVAGCSNADSPSGGGDSNIVLGAASQGSSVYVTAVSMGEIVSQNSDVSATVQSVGGAVPIIRALEDGSVDMGMPQTAAVVNAYEGVGPFEEPVDVRMQLQGPSVPWQLIARSDAGIDSLADLEGKRLGGERPALTEIRAVSDAMLDAAGLTADDVQIESTNDTNEAIDALKQGTLDAVVLPGSIGASNMEELAFSSDVEWVDLSDHVGTMVETLGGAFEESTIPAGTYEGQEDDVEVVATRQVLIADEGASEDAVYSVTQAIMEHRSEIQGALADSWSVENTLSSEFVVPFHPGAVRYFEETGDWSSDLQRTQDELLEDEG